MQSETSTKITITSFDQQMKMVERLQASTKALVFKKLVLYCIRLHQPTLLKGLF